jgi:hypothetical protein
MALRRILLVLPTVFIIAGCPAKINLDITNSAGRELVVTYGDTTIDLTIDESQTLSAYVSSQILRVKSSKACVEIKGMLTNLPGEFYKPGFRHSISLNVEKDLSVSIVPIQEGTAANVRMEGQRCDSAA